MVRHGGWVGDHDHAGGLRRYASKSAASSIVD